MRKFFSSPLVFAVVGAMTFIGTTAHTQQTQTSGDEVDQRSETWERDSAALNGQWRQQSATGARDRSRLDELSRRPRIELYRGIIPGLRDDLWERDFLDAGDASDAAPNEITWIGLELEAERTRVFVQTKRPVEHRVRSGDDGEIVVTLSNTRITKSNFARFIDASHFRRGVDRIETSEVSGGDVELRVTGTAASNPSMSSDGRYLNIDFSHQQDEQGPHRGTRDQTAGDEVRESQEMAAAESRGELGPAEPSTPEPEEEPQEEEPMVAIDDRDEYDDLVVEDLDAEVEDQDDESAGVSTRRILAVSTAVAGVALAGTGGGLALYADSQRSVITDVPRQDLVPITQREAADIEQRTNRLDTTGLVLAVAGGLAVATGGVLWWTDSAGDSSEGLSLRPNVDVSERMVGMDWTLRF